ncbi:hypothetical protein PR048_031207 [Dryococelus australis]|uniref:Uncharacterized protein n=1 Tax=Dryococelus australis TaxID=614101 RepID=A0ABQ9G8Q3_9NEOP|nr:hypothetical protein PR048_031207 [Dryococelus australis]
MLFLEGAWDVDEHVCPALLTQLLLLWWGRGGLGVRLLASRQDEPGSMPCRVALGVSHMGIVLDEATDRRVFLGISLSPRPCILTLLHTHFVSPSWALKTKRLSAAQISIREEIIPGNRLDAKYQHVSVAVWLLYVVFPKPSVHLRLVHREILKVSSTARSLETVQVAQGRGSGEGIGHGLCWGPIPVFAWSDFGKPWDTEIRIAGPLREPVTLQKCFGTALYVAEYLFRQLQTPTPPKQCHRLATVWCNVVRQSASGVRGLRRASCGQNVAGGALIAREGTAPRDRGWKFLSLVDGGGGELGGGRQRYAGRGCWGRVIAACPPIHLRSLCRRRFFDHTKAMEADPEILPEGFPPATEMTPSTLSGGISISGRGRRGEATRRILKCFFTWFTGHPTPPPPPPRETMPRIPHFCWAVMDERLDCSPPTKANRVQPPAGSFPNYRMWESCRTMPLAGGFYRECHVSLALSLWRCSILSSLTFIGSQDLAVKSRPNLFTRFKYTTSAATDFYNPQRIREGSGPEGNIPEHHLADCEIILQVCLMKSSQPAGKGLWRKGPTGENEIIRSSARAKNAPRREHCYRLFTEIDVRDDTRLATVPPTCCSIPSPTRPTTRSLTHTPDLPPIAEASAQHKSAGELQPTHTSLETFLKSCSSCTSSRFLHLLQTTLNPCRLCSSLGSPLVDEPPIITAIKYRVVSGVVWTNRTMVSSNTDTKRTDVLARRRNCVAVPLKQAYPFSDWLRESPGAGLVSDWLASVAKGYFIGCTAGWRVGHKVLIGERRFNRFANKRRHIAGLEDLRRGIDMYFTVIDGWSFCCFQNQNHFGEKGSPRNDAIPNKTQFRFYRSFTDASRLPEVLVKFYFQDIPPRRANKA